MDGSSEEVIDFAMIPIETVAASTSILGAIQRAFSRNASPLVDIHQIEKFYHYGKKLVSKSEEKWPRIVRENSIIHRAMVELNDLAAFWVKSSPIFRDCRDPLETYLEFRYGFSASNLIVNGCGAIINREAILLLQQLYFKGCRKDIIVEQINSPESREAYDEFLTTLMWMRIDPRRRMFKNGFRGTYHERTTMAKDRKVNLENLSIADDDSSTAMLTPTITRSTSPAHTELLIESDQDGMRENGTSSTDLPTLKFMAVIETPTDKAIYEMDDSDIYDTASAKLHTALDMCKQMIRKGYGGKVKLQDILDMALRTA